MGFLQCQYPKLGLDVWWELALGLGIAFLECQKPTGDRKAGFKAHGGDGDEESKQRHGDEEDNEDEEAVHQKEAVHGPHNERNWDDIHAEKHIVDRADGPWYGPNIELRFDGYLVVISRWFDGYLTVEN